jgi:DeoR/GlpR family transcriptional regulator of sugar metabolism
MLNVERLDYVIEELKSKRAVYVKQLAKKFYVSESTIRRDLNQLEKDGYLRRTCGGAVISDQKNNETPFAIRKIEKHQEKDCMGALASMLVKDDMFILLDSSSTVMHMMKYLSHKNNLRIITTSAQIALNCMDLPNTQVFCSGGWMNTYSGGFFGETAKQSIEGYITDILFISARAISMEHGVTDISEEETEIRHTMLKKAKKVVLLCDSSKFDQVSFKHVCDLSRIDCLVTEIKPSNLWMETLKKMGVKVLYPGVRQDPSV